MAEPTVPKAVKAEIKKELAKKDFSWIRRDWIIVGVLFVLIAVMNVTSIIAARNASSAASKAAQAVQQTDIIAECFTPGTRCSNFRAQSDVEERIYITAVMKTTAICTLLTSRAARDVTDPAQLDSIYQACVDSRVSPPPSMIN